MQRWRGCGLPGTLETPACLSRPRPPPRSQAAAWILATVWGLWGLGRGLLGLTAPVPPCGHPQAQLLSTCWHDKYGPSIFAFKHSQATLHLQFLLRSQRPCLVRRLRAVTPSAGKGDRTLCSCSPEFCAAMDHPARGRGAVRPSTNTCWISEWSKIPKIPQSQEARPQAAGPWASGFALSLGFLICKVEETIPYSFSGDSLDSKITHENARKFRRKLHPALQVGRRAERPPGTPRPGPAVRSALDSTPAVTLPAGSMYG